MNEKLMQHVHDVAYKIEKDARYSYAASHLSHEDFVQVNKHLCLLFTLPIDHNTLHAELHLLEVALMASVTTNMLNLLTTFKQPLEPNAFGWRN